MHKILVLIFLSFASIASAQERIDTYTKLARPLGSFDLTFPGPGGGFTLANLDVQYVDGFGDTTYRTLPYMIDFTVSSEGTFIPPDTSRSSEEYVEHVVRLGDDRFVRANLARSEAKSDMRALEKKFAGVLGYFFFRKYISVFDFKRNKLTLYPLFASINIRERDTNAIQIEYKDDALISYCHCPFPTAWLEADAPPLKQGRVYFGFGNPYSEVYTNSLDAKTRAIFEKETEIDSLTGRKKTPGFSLATFRLANRNIASHNPKRLVNDLPPLFKDLNVPVLGSLGTDVLRTFSAVIFDPSRGKVVLVK
ncbi:MAG TPA: hypothetical protein VFH43_14635 [Candidatus Kapabacteria bacterium]|nr:hypothetical protein [Candidatus Kapabacteria bacterium]